MQINEPVKDCRTAVADRTIGCLLGGAVAEDLVHCPRLTAQELSAPDWAEKYICIRHES